MMTDGYQATIEWLFSLENMGIKLGLERMRELLHALGDPQDRFRSVHVAGTNGKGSVSAMLASIFVEAGLRTGLYTSPHLIDFTERVQIDGGTIDRGTVADLVMEIREVMASKDFPKGRELTFFEVTTAMAFLYFQRSGVEVAVIEVGMGGRLDATNVIRPECCVITPLGLEHTQHLGQTLAQIAYEKAGIIKEGVTVISAQQDMEALRIIDAVARDRGSPLLVEGREFRYRLLRSDWDGIQVNLCSLDKEVRIPLLGGYQAGNAALACECAIEVGKRFPEVTQTAISTGLGKVRWPGRIEVVSRDPLIVFDVTHTPQGAKEVSAELARLQKKWVLVLGVLNDKDLDGICAQFGPLALKGVATSPHSARAYPAEIVARALSDHCPEVTTEAEVGKAIERAISMAEQDVGVLVTGSLYMVGEAMAWWKQRR